MHRHQVAQAHLEVAAHHAVHADLVVVHALVGQHNAHGLAALLALEQHRVAAEQLQLLHLGQAHGHHRVVVVGRLVHDQAVGARRGG